MRVVTLNGGKNFSSKTTFRVCCASVESSPARGIDKIERVQRRVTRVSTGFEKLDYEERLKRLSLITLDDRRLSGDLIETNKVMSNRENINWVKPLSLRKNMDLSVPSENVRGNSLRMRRESFNSIIRNKF